MPFVRKRWIKTAFIGCSLLLLFYAFAPRWILKNAVDASVIKEAFIRRLEEDYPIKARCSVVRYRAGRIELLDLRLNTPDGNPIIQAPVTWVDLSLGRLLLHPTQSRYALSGLTFINPVLFLKKEASGRWNVERFLRASRKDWLDLTIRVRNGKVKLPSEIEGWRPGDLYAIRGELRFSHRREAVWKAGFRTTRAKETTLTADGRWSSPAAGYLAIKADRLSLPLIEKELRGKIDLSKWGLSSLSGRCDVGARLERNPKGWKLTGISARLNNAGLKWNKLGNPLKGINGSVRFFPDHIQLGDVKGYLGSAPFRLDGSLDLSGARADRVLSLQGDGFELGALSNVHPFFPAWRIKGQADLRLEFSGTFRDPRLHGEIRISRFSGREPSRGWRFSGTKSLIVLDDQGIRIRNLEGDLEGSVWSASGCVRNWENPQWDVHLTAQNIETGRFFPSLPVETGRLTAEARITGPLRQPDISWKAGSDRMLWEGWSGSDAAAEGRYRLENGLLTVDHLRITVNGTLLEGRGTVETRGADPGFKVELHAARIDLAELPSMVRVRFNIPPLAGTVRLDLAGTGRIKEPSSWMIRGAVEGTGGRLSAIDYQNLTGRFSLQNKKLYVEQFKLSQTAGTLTAAGSWSANAGLEGDLVLQNIRLSSAASARISAAVQCYASGQFHLRGKGGIETVSGRGWLDLSDLRYGKEKIGDLRLNADIRQGQVYLDQSSLRLDLGNRVDISGYMTFDGDVPALNLRLSSEDLGLSMIRRFLPFHSPVEIDGEASARIDLAGSLFQPEVSGRILIRNAKVAGYLLGPAELRLAWREGTLQVEEAQIRHGDGFVALSGGIGMKDVRLVAKAARFPLEALKLSLGGVPVRGELNFTGTVRGEFDHLQAEGNLSADGLNLAGLDIRHIEGDVGWKERTLILNNLVVEREKQRLLVLGDVLFAKEPQMNLKVKMEATRLRELMLIAGLRPAVPVDGVVTGTLKLTGAFSKPRLQLTAGVENGFVDGYAGIKGVVDIETDGKEFTIRRLQLSDPEWSLTAEGSYEPGVNAALELNVSNFNLEPLGKLAGAEEGLDGRLDLRADLECGAGGVQGRISGRIRDGKWRSVLLPLTELRGDIRNDVLRLELEQKEIGVVVKGKGPIQPQWFRFLKLPGKWPRREDPIYWKIEAPQISADTLEKVFPLIKLDGGGVSAFVTVQGTWRSPEINGTIALKNLKGRIEMLPEQFKDVNGEIRIRNNKLSIARIASRYGKGGLSVNGGAVLNGFVPADLNLSVKCRRFRFKNPAFDGLIDGEFHITGALPDPLISGEAVVNDSRLSIVRSKRLKRFNPRLDLLVRSGRNNYFHQFGLANILMEGELRIGGTLKQPRLKGRLTSARGTVSLYGNTFRLIGAEAVFSPENGYYPYIDGQAVTRAKDVEIRLSVNGLTGKTLNIHFDSTPPKSDEDIAALLHWSDVSVNGLSLLQKNINSVIDSLFGPTLNQFKQTLGVDFLDIEQDQISGPFRLNIGKSLFNRFFVTYSRTLDPTEQDSWSFEYSLTSNLSFVSEYSSENGTFFQLNLRFHF